MVKLNLGLQEIKKRLYLCDISAIDLDECVYPGFSQKDLGVKILEKILTKPLNHSDYTHLIALFKGSSRSLKYRLKRMVGIKSPNIQMFRHYEKIMRNIPEKYFTHCSNLLPANSTPYSLPAIAHLACKMPTGFISLGIESIFEAYDNYLLTNYSVGISFYRCNRIIFEKNRNIPSLKLFKGYDFLRLMSNPADKLKNLKEVMNIHKSKKPLIIGHNKEEVEMFDFADKNGGLAIGFNPDEKGKKYCHISFYGENWKELYQFLKRNK